MKFFPLAHVGLEVFLLLSTKNKITENKKRIREALSYGRAGLEPRR